MVYEPGIVVANVHTEGEHWYVINLMYPTKSQNAAINHIEQLMKQQRERQGP